ncbi:MAG: protein kinase [Lentisphaeria bacterium]|jgi:serine/threonine protein kinase/CheY-like chemotaxis protein|nr:protein kinase [Lentisphaeria bacterium]MDP7741583.1 protein kinase [Lentisphaeria bacterium]
MSARILIVDDEPTMRQLLRTHLKRQNYEILEAAAAAEGLSIVKENDLDLVITDVKLGGTTGVELLTQIKRIYPDLPVIVMTGMPEIEDAVESMKIGAVDYVSKPFRIEQLKAVITQALEPSGETKPAANVPAPANCGRILAGYQVIKPLGEGNVGTVYLVRDRDDDSAAVYALKVLKTFFRTEEHKRNALERLLREAESVAELQHPNIVRVIEYGLAEEDLVPFILMEYVDGKSLQEVISDSDDLTYMKKARIIRQVADALAAVHKHDICHRDIKPANILLDANNDAKLTDFGIALMPDSSLTVSTNLVGTPVYLSPEGFHSSKVDRRTDIFSLGVVAYELFMLQRPFVAESIAQYANVIQNDRPMEPRRLQPDFPLRLQSILARMLKKEPDERYNNTDELVGDLDAYINSPPLRSNILQKLLDRQRQRDWRRS